MKRLCVETVKSCMNKAAFLELGRLAKPLLEIEGSEGFKATRAASSRGRSESRSPSPERTPSPAASRSPSPEAASRARRGRSTSSPRRERTPHSSPPRERSSTPVPRKRKIDLLTINNVEPQGFVTIKLSNAKAATLGVDVELASEIDVELDNDTVCLWTEKSCYQAKVSKNAKPWFSLFRC